MGKALRRTSAVGATLAAAVAFSGAAMAAPADPYQDNADQISQAFSIDNRVDHLYRVAGQDRVVTSIKLMEASSKWDNLEGGHAIIATSADFADALSAGPLADVYDAPILLSAPGDAVDGRVVKALQDKGFNQVTLIGGTGVFSEKARAQLTNAGMTVDRQRGIDRYETAVGIAKQVVKFSDQAGANRRAVNVYLATGTDFPDALAAGAAAADNDGVVLLSKDTTVEHFTYDFLTTERKNIPEWKNGVEIFTVGGQAEQAAKTSGIEDVKKSYSGANRYATAIMLAKDYTHPINKIAIASGEGFADGVAAGGWIANHDGALLLTQNARLNPETKAYLNTTADTTQDWVVVGGTGSVSRNVSDQLVQMRTF